MSKDCCNGQEQDSYNPKTGYKLNPEQKRVYKFNRLRPPIEDEITDVGDLKQFFDQLKNVFVPYAGTSSVSKDSTIYLLEMLAKLSPTKGAVIQAIKRFAFHKIDIVFNTDPCFDLGEEEVSEPSLPEKKEFYNFLKDNVKWFGVDSQETDLKTFTGHLFESYKATGNYYIELVFSESLDVKSASVYAHKASHCRYLATKKGQDKFIGISTKWDLESYERKKIDVLPLFPNYKNENGVKRTIIHKKHGNNTWYGRPEGLPSLMAQYLEYQNLDYLNKETANRFMGQFIMEIEMDNPELYEMDEESIEAGHKGLLDQIEVNFSAKSENPSPFLITTRGFGSKEMKVHEKAANTNESYYETIDELLSRKIIQGEGWSKDFLSGEVPTGFSTSAYLDQYKTLIRPIVVSNSQRESEQINKVIFEIVRFFEKAEFERIGIKYKDIHSKLIQEANEENINDSVGSSEVESSE